MSPDRLYQVVDPISSIEGVLTIQRGQDGAAAAVVVELRNPAAAGALVLRVNREMTAFIMLTVTNDQGRVLSTPARKFDTATAQQFDEVRLAPGAAHRWHVPLAAQLRPDALPAQSLQGRLVVNVALQFARAVGDGPIEPAGFALALLTFYDMDIPFSPAALAEGAGEESVDA